jgi:hypothetical protein
MNEASVKKAYSGLLALSILSAAGAVLTLVPSSAAPWANILGYKSICSFAPISTALCALLAGTSCTLRARLFGPRRGERRSWAAPLAVALVLAAVIGLSIPSYTRAMADAASGASLSVRK